MNLGPILRAMGRNKARFGLIALEIALTLAIGVAVSMFSAVFVTRSLLRTLVHWNVALRPEFFGVTRHTPPTAPAAPGGPAVAAPGVGR